MKQKDIALIIVVAFISAVTSFFISKSLFGTSGDKAQTAEVVDAVSTEFQQPSAKYFNPEAINPTQPIQIGVGSNQNPFGGTQ